MQQSNERLFSCTLCDELLGESSHSTECGHIFHLNCIRKWYRFKARSCPTCKSHIAQVIKLFPTDSQLFTVITTEEMASLHKQLSNVKMSNIMYQFRMNDLTSKLNTSEDNLKESQIAFNEINAIYSDHLNGSNEININPKKDASEDYKFNEERSKRILLQKEVYEYQARNSAELNKLKSEIEKLKSEIAFEQPSTSSKNTRRKITLPRQIQSPKFQPSPDGFLSNCHFWIVDDLRKVAGATNHLYFNEHCIQEHGGTIAYHYTNMVTHVIGISQKNVEVLRGLNQHKKCVTDYWLGDIIGAKKIIKPWLAHHLPIPYSEDNLPYQNKQIAIANFSKNDYYKVRAMVEVTGATVNNKISRSTYIVIALKLEGAMINKALDFKIPVVNVKWMNDILLGVKISLKHFDRKKYQKYDLPNPYHISYNKVSHLMEAWDERPKIPKFKLPSNKINKSPMTKKRIETCVKQELLPSGVNNGDGNNTTT
ncbi:PAX-interacting protein 1-like [Metopolophium dirhodum]|uniref:PAX-interacting protein 1-like n=1 Tax=Metopolophium dirhodum TaxID=44670 RepID=UPI00298FB866|nr:PAX-interacting protein 1-like [Metopolophium dirhodum]